jgi:hypothetical protein
MVIATTGIDCSKRMADLSFTIWLCSRRSASGAGMFSCRPTIARAAFVENAA